MLSKAAFIPPCHRNSGDEVFQPPGPRQTRAVSTLSASLKGLLSISTKTVESYKATALEKLKLRSRNDIVRYAIARGWLSDEVAPD